jgi:iron complex transport system ATP-binding protein
MLEVRNLTFDYHDHRILDGIDLRLERPRVLSIVGPNGTGKTTFLKCILGILQPGSGSILIEGEESHRLPRRELAKRVAYVPQNIPYRFPTTVFDMVLAGRRPHMAWRPSESDLSHAAWIIEEMNLTELAMREMISLSGGQAQKVLLARALAQEPLFLLLDEPTSSLDLRHQLEMLEVISSLKATKKMGVLMAMHDLNLAARFSDTITMFHGGKIFRSGSPAEVMTPENIAEVYGVEAIVRRENGHIQIQPLRCTAGNGTRRPATAKDPQPHQGVSA